MLNEKVKGALVRRSFLKYNMDGPTSFFFNLERKEKRKREMYVLKDNNGLETKEKVTDAVKGLSKGKVGWTIC